MNRRILNVLKKKISGLQTAYRRTSKAGGKSQAKLLNGWTAGPKYQFKIDYNEVEVQKVKTQCEIRRGQIPGGHLGIFWVGMCRPGLQIGTPF